MRLGDLSALPPGVSVLLHGGDEWPEGAGEGFVPVLVTVPPPLPDALRPLLARRLILWPDAQDLAREIVRPLFEMDVALPPEVVRVQLPPFVPVDIAFDPRRVLAAFGAPMFCALIDNAMRVQTPKAEAGAWRLADLMRAQFPKPTFVVDGLIPDEGLVLIAGREKWGKSWMMLQLAAAVASGGTFLGRRCDRRRVLVLALEDSPARLQQRFLLQHIEPTLPIELHLFCTPLDQKGGPEALRERIVNSGAKLVIVDTFASSLSGKLDEDSAREMGPLANRLRRLAQELHVVIVLVHHQSKGESRDVGADARGSVALPAAADLIVGVYQADGACRLVAKGRDIAPVELRLQFDAGTTFCWQPLADPREATRDDTDGRTETALREIGGSAHAGELARRLGCSRERARQLGDRLVGARRARRLDGPSGRVTFELTEDGALELHGLHPLQDAVEPGSAATGVRGARAFSPAGRSRPVTENGCDCSAMPDAESEGGLL